MEKSKYQTEKESRITTLQEERGTLESRLANSNYMAADWNRAKAFKRLKDVKAELNSIYNRMHSEELAADALREKSVRGAESLGADD